MTADTKLVITMVARLFLIYLLTALAGLVAGIMIAEVSLWLTPSLL